jgi:hypothetical protein
MWPYLLQKMHWPMVLEIRTKHEMSHLHWIAALCESWQHSNKLYSARPYRAADSRCYNKTYQTLSKSLRQRSSLLLQGMQDSCLREMSEQSQCSHRSMSWTIRLGGREKEDNLRTHRTASIGRKFPDSSIEQHLGWRLSYSGELKLSLY